MRVLLFAAIGVGAWAQTPPEPLQAPWEGVPESFRKLPIGRLNLSDDLGGWKAQRAKVKRIVTESLGELPARPVARVRVVRVDQRDGWRVEKSEFDNGADSLVPGYIAIPDGGKRRPAILTMHGHSSSKENMFGGIYYFVPGLLKRFDSEGVMALLAPRPFLALTGDRDAGSPPEGMRKLEDIEGEVYRLYGKPEAFQSIVHPEIGHVYNDDQKRKMVEWFNRHLAGGQS
ncbi:MAG: hypothetical protein KIT09_22255 [Bryobacteraceae bacterium]|nr:hypothetical protein [Bryobacteraceae bacterium]